MFVAGRVQRSVCVVTERNHSIESEVQYLFFCYCDVQYDDCTFVYLLLICVCYMTLTCDVCIIQGHNMYRGHLGEFILIPNCVWLQVPYGKLQYI